MAPADVRAIRDGAWVSYIPPRIPIPDFEPGVSEPFYFPDVNIDQAQTNVGNRATRQDGVTLTPYAGALTNQVAILSGATYENVLFNSPIDIRAGAHLINCRVVVPTTYTSTAQSECVRSLNGGSNTGGVLQNVEIHNRAQRPLNGFAGRNFEVYETVITGCVDGFSESTGGSAPQDFGIRVYDSVVTDMAWWYTPTVNGIIHGSDTQSHNDAYQKGTTLASEIRNTALVPYLSAIIGTGTPGAGSETNPYTPASGYNFIASQATQEGWRSTRVGLFPTGSESRYGVAKLYVISGGSVAALMINRDNLIADRIYFGGGAQAQIDATDTNLPTSMNVRITNSTFANDMRNPNASRGTTKGYAGLIRTGKSMAAFTGNTWLDGSPVSLTSF